MNPFDQFDTKETPAPFDQFDEKTGVNPFDQFDEFDPEGAGYDMKSALSAGLNPAENGHWPSRNPQTGQMLKGKKHETWDLLERGEKESGYDVYKGEDNKYYSQPNFENLSKSILDKFNSGTFKADQLDAFTELNKRGFFSDPMSVADLGGAKLGEPPAPAPVQPKSPEKEIIVPDWAKDHPNLFGTYGAGKAILEKGVTPAVEAGGMILGGIIGTPIVGSAIGYGISKKLMNLVEDYYGQLGGEKPKERTYLGEAAETAKDVAIVAATGAAFEAAPKILKAVGESKAAKTSAGYLFDTLPKRMYAQSVNAPMGQKWITQLRGKDLSKRTLAIEEGLSSKLPPNKLNIAKVDKLRREAWDHIEDTANILSENPNNKLAVEDMVVAARKWATKKPRTEAELKAIETVVDDLKTYGEYITPRQALDIKTELHKRTPIGDPKAAVKDLTNEGAANYLMTSLEKMDIGFKATNQTYLARASLKDILVKAVAQQEKKASLGLSTKFFLVHKWPLALWNETFAHPAVRSRMALVLAKGNKAKYSQFIYPDKPLGYSPPVKQLEADVYRYMPEINYVKSTTPKPPLVTVRSAEPKVDIKTQAELRSVEEKRAVERAVDLAFAKQMASKKTIGSPLIQPSKAYTKATQPPVIKTTLHPAEMKQIIKTKVAERIEKEEIARALHLEQVFKEAERKKGLIGPPLIKRGFEGTKSTIPPSVEDRLKGLDI